MAGIVIGIVVFLLLLFARQLIHLALLLGVLLVQIFLLLVVDGSYARTRYSLLFGLALVGSVLWHLYAPRPV
ncbi:hypothetical protein [Devosia sp. Root105]|uniref:hypothetical protein n=1 Tax=Devosia sp. Root105 TaxID=1736423 RepID=UPI0007005A1F|nr:hypothetical protein [Devosia sp. Root105]KQU93891.1 hypothetical protein ASC68_19605 [Devosia sp. Root105]